MKKGLKTLISGIVIFIVGAFVAPLAVIIPVILALDDSDKRQFIIPGEHQFEIEKPARYYLWNDYQTIFDGKSYNRSESLPDGLQISIKDEAGEELKFTSNTMMSSSTGSSTKNTIGYVEVTAPGTLTIRVTGDSDARVFSFSEFSVLKIVGLAFGAFGIGMLIAVAGIGLSIWGIVKLVKNDTKAAKSPLHSF
ncbi:hypothetical protein [Rubellicoccus peritrichatus]|uniref:Uncharacterized protein n=1 Tax=Rubellicoccus peritrichatus TaxID=3080537 RepID=A0AAQ3LEI4_9BACT|nr:hypothetical protein [Puniceicoccus sp. CR14]WOO43237.1 hypothetical protein RZN69_09060 [Puniceicoccus sp. CR14]